MGLTVELLDNWQLKFPAGSYIATIGGGNLIGGPGGDPVAFTAGVQIILIQSAASTVVTSSGDASAIAAATVAALNATAIPVNIVKVNSLTVDGTGTDGDPWGPV